MQKQAETDIHQENDFGLGEVIVSPSHNTLSAKGQTVTLQPKAMAVLHYLAKNQTRVIGNQELIDRLWEGRIVTHGSVQKSINSIRTAFAELKIDQELITHYSKRGYQLQIEPNFYQPSPLPLSLPEHDVTLGPVSVIKKTTKKLPFVLIAVVVITAFIAFRFVSNPIPKVDKHHKTRFTTTQGYTNETGHERNAVPHPDNQHLVYVREQFIGPSETQSELVIRNAQGKDWSVAKTNGSWFRLAWSPEGKHLVAVEVIQMEGMPSTPGFYEKPNYLYSFHIFSLDLEKKLLLEKQLLSQWQGRVFSVSWWDENTLEFVARQGTGATSGRYRYSTLHQELIALDEIEGVTNPISSVVHNKRTALSSLYKNKMQIDFLNEDQSLISRWHLNYSSAGISWIPDGSGVLIYSDERKLRVLYLDGQQEEISLADSRDKIFSYPRYSADGNSIFYTEEKRRSNILLLNPNGEKIPLTQNTDFNYSASFSPNGKQVVYASVRNNQTNLWLVEAGQERQLTQQPIPKRVGSIIWSEDAGSLVFNAGANIYRYDFASAETTLLWSDSSNIEPLAYLFTSQQLFLLKQLGEVKNIWRVDLTKKQQKQLTFGSVGSAMADSGDVYFQYTDEAGLWVFQGKTETLKLVTPKLAEHNKLLKAVPEGIYFVSGGVCRESDIYYLDFASQAVSTFLKREQNLVMTTGYSPNSGVLHTECYLAEANIVQMK